MALMSIWDILEIEATSDTKVIKRAYAKKLKVTRPDEDPKGFQELHWAYKTALQHAEWMARREAAGDDEEDYDDYENEYEQTIFEPTSSHLSPNEQPPSLATIDAQEQKNKIDLLQQEANRIIDSVKTLLASGNQAEKESWSFIVESPFILEDGFNWNLGLKILTLIREHNLKNLSKIPEMVGQDALTYLDAIFNWKNNQYQIYSTLGKEYETWIELILDAPRNISWQDKIRGGKKLSEQKVKSKKNKAVEQSKSSDSSGCMIFILIILVIKFMVIISDNLTPDKPKNIPINPDSYKHIQLINNNPLGMPGAKPKEVISSTTDTTTTTEKPKEYRCNYSKHDKVNLSSLCRPIDMEKLEP
jgi:hypothetical protein